jgi:nitrite reductase/ring-hydroxylating ferredoxin subunit
VKVTIGGKGIAIFNVGGTLRAVDARCTHVGGPLDQGTVEAGVVTCPLHGSQFDLATGTVRRGPAARAIATYPVRVEAGTLVIDLP